MAGSFTLHLHLGHLADVFIQSDVQFTMKVYLTVFSVKQLEALDVLQLYALGQSLPLQVDVRKLWQGSGCVWRQERKPL